MEITNEDEVRAIVSHRFWKARSNKKKALLWSSIIILAICVLFMIAYMTDRNAEYESADGHEVTVRNFDVELDGFDMTRTDETEAAPFLISMGLLIVFGIIAITIIVIDQKKLNTEKREAVKEFHISSTPQSYFPE